MIFSVLIISVYKQHECVREMKSQVTTDFRYSICEGFLKGCSSLTAEVG